VSLRSTHADVFPFLTLRIAIESRGSSGLDAANVSPERTTRRPGVGVEINPA
jgi:hypothetical protein